MDEFCHDYGSVMDMALSSGVRSVALRTDLDRPFASAREFNRFYSACHRGFEKAQDRIVKMIGDIRGDAGLRGDRKQYRELLLRKVADAVAFMMLGAKLHAIRRLSLGTEPPYMDLDVIQSALDHVHSMNLESRMTFALLADLTTFIHVADVLRIDLRRSKPSLDLIELKSGTVNRMLVKELDKYKPKKESLDLLRDDPSIDKKFAKQAARMMRQRIRLGQIRDVLVANEGIDPGLGQPIILSRYEIDTEDYDDFLNELCTEAVKTGGAAGMVQNCIHIGVGFSEVPDEAAMMATRALDYGVRKQLKDPPRRLNDVRDELEAMIPIEEMFKASNPFLNNVYKCPTRPFTLWRLSRENLMRVITGKLSVASALDLAGFIWLGRSAGLNVGVSSRREATQCAQRIGSDSLATWRGRVPKYKAPDGAEVLVLGGMFSRFMCNLSTPLQFFKCEMLTVAPDGQARSD